MKRIVFLFSLLAIVACSKNKDDNKLTRDILFQIAVSGKWEVNLYSDGEDIKTGDYANYRFELQTSNSIKATNTLNTYNGTWFADESDEPQNKTGLILNISFEAPETFVSLSRDWEVLSAEQSTIRLRYINGDVIEFLTLMNIK